MLGRGVISHTRRRGRSRIQSHAALILGDRIEHGDLAGVELERMKDKFLNQLKRRIADRCSRVWAAPSYTEEIANSGCGETSVNKIAGEHAR